MRIIIAYTILLFFGACAWRWIWYIFYYSLFSPSFNRGFLLKHVGFLYLFTEFLIGTESWWWLLLWNGWRWKALSLISSRDHCQRFSPSYISGTPRAGFEPAQNLSSGCCMELCGSDNHLVCNKNAINSLKVSETWIKSTIGYKHVKNGNLPIITTN